MDTRGRDHRYRMRESGGTGGSILDNGAMPEPQRLTSGEIGRLVYNWIGVDAGYLNGFSYAKHDRFWLHVADIHVDTARHPPTRRCFEDTLGSVSALHQAAALREILERFPPPEAPDPANPNFQSSKLHREILAWISRLETGTASVPVVLQSPPEVVQLALDDADALIKATGPQSAVDRLHTALHGYLRSLCEDEQIEVGQERPTLNQLFRALRDNHSALANLGARGDDIRKMLGSMASILDALNPVRNKASVAHPNAKLVGEAEAVLVVNLVRTMLGYLEQRRRGSSD